MTVNLVPSSQIINLAEGLLLGFSYYDFGVTVAMLSPCSLPVRLREALHPLEIFKMVNFQGGECLL